MFRACATAVALGALVAVPASAQAARSHRATNWVEALYQYTLYSGNLAPLKRVYANLRRLIDGLYPRHVGSDGLLVNRLGADDYAFIPRQGTRVAYYNAQYVRTLREAAALAGWSNDARREQRRGGPARSSRPVSPRRPARPGPTRRVRGRTACTRRRGASL